MQTWMRSVSDSLGPQILSSAAAPGRNETFGQKLSESFRPTAVSPAGSNNSCATAERFSNGTGVEQAFATKWKAYKCEPGISARQAKKDGRLATLFLGASVGVSSFQSHLTW